MLPDDVLLEIFDFCVYQDFDGVYSEKEIVEKWIGLAHVCRRWRSVVLQSPHRLNLRLVCTLNTPARETLDIWPPLPLIIRDFGIPSRPVTSAGVDNTIAVVEHNDRVCQIELINFTSSRLGQFTDSAAMQKPFPELTGLRLAVYKDDRPGSILPDSFLGGITPRLRSFDLRGVPFPGLWKLLLSATHLVDLDLDYIPRSGYITPEAMATTLSALTSLEYLRLAFRYPRPRPALESRRPPPPPLTRSILPSLTVIRFKGASEYLEVILARIDAPQIEDLSITFFNQIIFDTPQLFQFIRRRPTLRALEKGRIAFLSKAIIFDFRSQTSFHDVLSVHMRCAVPEWQLSSLEQVCTSSLPPISTLEDLYILENRGDEDPRWQDDFEDTLWLDLLRSFVALKNLYLSKEFVPRIAPALQALVGGSTTEVLPTLENIFLEGFQPSGPLLKGIEKFVAARQLTSHPVAVSRWEGYSKRELPQEPGNIYDW